MAIPQKRFESLDDEFNIPVSTVENVKPSSNTVINSDYNTPVTVKKELQKVIQQQTGKLDVKQLYKDLKQNKSGINEILGIKKSKQNVNTDTDIREVKGINRSSVDTSKFTSKEIEKLITEIFGDDVSVQNSFKQLEQDYRNAVLADITVGKPFDKEIDTSIDVDDVGLQKYNYPLISSIINRLSNSQYSQTTVDKNILLKKLVTVANLSYDARMGGVLEALKNITNYRSDVFARASSVVLQEQAIKGNAVAVIDISGQVDIDNYPISQIPSIVSDIFRNFKIPEGVREKDFSILVDLLLAAILIYDNKWNVSLHDGILSSANAIEATPCIINLLHSKMLQNIFTEDELTATFSSDYDLLVSSMKANKPFQIQMLNNFAGIK